MNNNTSSNYKTLGGPNALIDTQTSADGLAKVIEQSTQENSGQFINYDGTELPW
ncbi:oxidoreductase [Vibrio owensii]|nr:oxidoreductase [Vibrio owensii]